MTDDTRTRLEGRCPVCNVKLVRIVKDGVTSALSHGRPQCAEYKRLSAQDFTNRYLN